MPRWVPCRGRFRAVLWPVLLPRCVVLILQVLCICVLVGFAWAVLGVGLALAVGRAARLAYERRAAEVGG